MLAKLSQCKGQESMEMFWDGERAGGGIVGKRAILPDPSPVPEHPGSSPRLFLVCAINFRGTDPNSPMGAAAQAKGKKLPIPSAGTAAAPNMC